MIGSRTQVRRAVRYAGCAAGCAIAWLLPGIGLAQAPAADDVARAEVLFRRGRELMRAGKHTEACPLFEQSQRLDPGGGTLLNLGICHAAEGKTATAWRELREALELARKAGQAEAESTALQSLAEIEPKLSHLTVVVPAETAAIKGVFIKRNGDPVERATWGKAFPVDPGSYSIEASAPGYSPWKTHVKVGAEADRQSVMVKLAPSAVQAAPPAPSSSAAQSSSGTWMRPVGYTVGAVGLLALGTAAVSGAIAGVAWSDSKALCPKPKCSSKEGVDLYEQANLAANVSNGSLGVGIAGVAAGLTLLLLSKPASNTAPAKQGQTWVLPFAGAQTAGISVARHW